MKVADQHQWTLRLKQRRTTVLLFVDRSQSFTSIKQELLEAIKATGKATLNDQALPTDPDDVILGIPVDRYDLSKGWVGLDIPDFDEDGGRTKKAGKNSILNSSPLGAGLKDGAVLAFKFRDSSMTEEEMDLDDNNWDVVLPNYEEEYGSQD